MSNLEDCPIMRELSVARAFAVSRIDDDALDEAVSAVERLYSEINSLRVENERLGQDAERWRYYERHYGGADLQEKVDAAMRAERRQ